MRLFTLVVAAFAPLSHGILSSDDWQQHSASERSLQSVHAPEKSNISRFVDKESTKTRALLRKEAAVTAPTASQNSPPKNFRILRSSGGHDVIPVQMKEGLFSLIAQKEGAAAVDPGEEPLTFPAMVATAAAHVAAQAANTAASEAGKAQVAAAHVAQAYATSVSSETHATSMGNIVTKALPKTPKKSQALLENVVDVQIKESEAPPSRKYDDATWHAKQKASTNSSTKDARKDDGRVKRDVGNAAEEASEAAAIALAAADAAAHDAKQAMQAAENAQAQLSRNESAAKDEHKGKDENPPAGPSAGVPTQMTQGIRIPSEQTSAPTEMKPEDRQKMQESSSKAKEASTAATVAAQAAEATAKNAQQAAQHVVEAVRAAQATTGTEKRLSTEGEQTLGQVRGTEISNSSPSANNTTAQEHIAIDKAKEDGNVNVTVRPHENTKDANTTTADESTHKQQTDADASKAQEAAVRAAVAAKVAEQTAHEAAIRATVASRTSEATTNASAAQQDETMVPPRGLVLSFLLGLVITAFMLACLLTVFACGDQLVQAQTKEKIETLTRSN